MDANDPGVRSALLRDTPVGTIALWVTPLGLRRIGFDADSLTIPHHTESIESFPYLAQAVSQLAEYFAGARNTFDLPLDLSGATAFQRKIYTRLVEIPFGRVVSYGDLADELGDPGAARAVGQAVGANPLPVVIPCHRVVRSDGRLGGFSGGLVRKVELLRLEGMDVDGPHATSKIHPEVIRLPLF